MAAILIVDDEEKIRSLVRKYAEYEGYIVFEARDGIEAVNICTTEDFDLIIMDVMMPNMDGFQASKQIRAVKDVPIIMLSARGEEYDRIHGFEVGVDDYVVKPFSPKELMMRVKVVLSRYQKADAKKKQEEANSGARHEVFTKDGLQVDFTSRLVFVDGEQKELTFKEYELLVYFIQNRNIALSREQILTKIWGFDYYGDDRTLDTHIKLLRNQLGPYRNCIVTIRGVGYRFDEK